MWGEHINYEHIHELHMLDDNHRCLWTRRCGRLAWYPVFCSLRCRIRSESFDFLYGFPMIQAIMDDIDMYSVLYVDEVCYTVLCLISQFRCFCCNHKFFPLLHIICLITSHPDTIVLSCQCFTIDVTTTKCYCYHIFHIKQTQNSICNKHDSVIK
jgi:hypothetical protein